MPTSTRSYTDLPAPAPPAPASLADRAGRMERVICPHCAARYRFAARALGEGHGLKVTCPKCQHCFVAVAPEPVGVTQPFPPFADLEEDIVGLWLDRKQRRRRLLGVTALLLAGIWGFVSASSDPVLESAVMTAVVTAPVVSEAPVAALDSEASTAVAAILALDLTEGADSPAGAPAMKPPAASRAPAPTPKLAEKQPASADKTLAVAPPAIVAVRVAVAVPAETAPAETAPDKPVADRTTAGLHWYEAAMDAQGKGNLALAEKMMERAVAKTPMRPDWWATLGNIQTQLGKDEDAPRSKGRARYLLANAN